MNSSCEGFDYPCFEGITLSTYYANYYLNVRRVMIGFSTLLTLYQFVRLRRSRGQSGYVRIITILASLIQLLRSIDPSGMGRLISVSINFALLWLLCSLTSTCQISCMAGFVEILVVHDPGNTIKVSKVLFYVQFLGDLFLVVASLYIELEAAQAGISVILGIGLFLGMSQRGGHILYCHFKSKSLEKSQNSPKIASLKFPTRSSAVATTQSKSKNREKRNAEYEKVNLWGERVRVGSFVNGILILTFAIYLSVTGFSYNEVDDPYSEWTLAFVFVDILIPLVQLLLLCLIAELIEVSQFFFPRGAYLRSSVGLLVLIRLAVVFLTEDEDDVESSHS